MMTIGEDGYQQRAKTIRGIALQLAAGIQSIPGLQLLTTNRQPVTVIVAFASSSDEDLNVYKIKDVLSELGWSVNPLQNPPGLNVCITANLNANEFLECLKLAVDRVRNETTRKGIDDSATGATAALYRAAETLPESTIQFSMHRFVDASLTP
ncbi:unnamed protein product [Cylindrotheca closterium]|uniref:Glutamate decarboxylase n=1 Tax=Cylindrotheca closterium TaxID=2856 RepID=A0AAD2CCF1_9STRA|nr:unnamed protein product [Cylindrotheca closterium]